MSRAPYVPVLIVGAGPYGISLAAHLRHREVPFRIVGRAMDSWVRNMPDDMFLKSEGFASNIADPIGSHTLARFCSEAGREYGDLAVPVPIETFRAYGLWFQHDLVPELEETAVVAIATDDREFNIELETGEKLTAGRVVVAVGLTYFRAVPPELRALTDRLWTHSADHRDFAQFSTTKVAVVGAGQSALETAALLHENGAAVTVLVRKPTVTWNSVPDDSDRSLTERLRRPIGALGPGWRTWLLAEAPRTFSRLPTRTRLRLALESLGPSGAWWLRSRVDGVVPILLDHRVVDARVQNGRATLRVAANASGEVELVVDHVVAATGYRVDVSRLPFLHPSLVERIDTWRHQLPALNSTFESSVPGLHFVGITAAARYGPMMRFVWGTRFASRRLARALA
jgi:FAD-dependent urate hydroxylase